MRRLIFTAMAVLAACSMPVQAQSVDLAAELRKLCEIAADLVKICTVKNRESIRNGERGVNCFRVERTAEKANEDWLKAAGLKDQVCAPWIPQYVRPSSDPFVKKKM